jgi:GH18 family chitinase
MRKLLLAILALAITAFAATPRVVGYYPYWAQYSQFYPKDVRYELLTQVHYGYLVPDASGELAFADASDEPNFVDLAKSVADREGLELMAVIGGQGNEDALRMVAASAEKRAALVKSALRFVKKYGLDGMELDWANPQSSDAENYSALLVALTEAFAEAELALSASVYGRASLDVYRSADLNNLDYVMVNMLDQMDESATEVSPNFSPVKATEAVERLVKKGVEPNLLIPIAPLYGKSYAQAQGLGTAHQGSGSGNEGYWSFKDLMDKFNGDSYKVSFDEDTQSEVAVSSQETIVFTGIPTVKALASYAKDEKLAGIAVYDISQDRCEPIVSLLVTAGKVLRPELNYKKKWK